VIVRVEDPVLVGISATVVELNDDVRPVPEGVDERVTLPVSPSRLVRVNPDVADEPTSIVRLAGVGERLKSGMKTGAVLKKAATATSEMLMIPSASMSALGS
jgi:hypothetical protein